MNKEKNKLESNIIIQNKKISPFIEIIDSSRLNENIVDLTNNKEDDCIIEKKIYNTENEKEKNKESIKAKIVYDEEPMTFNPKKKSNISNNIYNNLNNNKSNTNSIQKKTDDEDELNQINKNIDKEIELISKSSFYSGTKNDSNINYCNNIIDVLNKSLEKIKSYATEIKIFNSKNEIKENNMLINIIMEIKNNIIDILDKILMKTNNETANNQYNNYNINNSSGFYYNNSNCKKINSQSPFKVGEKSIFQIQNEDNNIYETKGDFLSNILDIKALNNNFNEKNCSLNNNKNNFAIDSKKEIYILKQENNYLKKIIENLKTLLDELVNKNKLLSSKVIKYKTLFEKMNN